MSVKGIVELHSGDTIALSSYLNEVPLFTFLTRTHVDVCDALSYHLGVDEERRRVYVNILRAHSESARAITAVVSLANARKIQLRRLVCACDPTRLRVLFDEGVSVDALPPRALVDRSQVARYMIKMLAHKVYRLWPTSKTRTDAAVRAWVELSEVIYPEVHRNGTVLIYPFYLNVRRQLRYVRHCLKTYPNVMLVGLPYVLFRFLVDLVSRRGRDYALVNAEATAFVKHAEEIARYAGKELLSNDEFEAGALCLANRLKEKSVKVTNTCHGLSFGSPYVGYDEFVVYNLAQKHYYGYKSSGTRFRIQIRRNADENEVPVQAAEYRPVVLLMHGNFTRDDLIYERRLEREIIRRMKVSAELMGIEFRVKLHPNALREDVDIFENAEQVPTIRRLDELGSVSPFFVATITTAIYDFYRDGPFLFVNEGIVPIEDIYGYPFPSVELEGLDSAITECLRQESYRSMLDAQINAIEGR